MDGVKYDVKYRLSPIVIGNMDVLESIMDEIFSHRQVKVSTAWSRFG
ncbi:MAG: hypothetical protein QW059_07745 [Nitrososphaerota archaeon]